MKRVDSKQEVVRANDQIAEQLRNCFQEYEILALNLIGSPGSGKTSLLEETLRRLPSSERAAVLTADVATDTDAVRLSAHGHPVAQICTGGASNLDAHMVATHVCPTCLHGEAGCSPVFDLLLIENVGNLVSPATVDLGEASKVIVFSVTEGDDKPQKYPTSFANADVVVLNKIDLLPHVEFDLPAFQESARRVRPLIEIMPVSCKTGAGIANWIRWLSGRLHSIRTSGERSAGTHTTP